MPKITKAEAKSYPTVNIHGKDYYPVASRVAMLHDALKGQHKAVAIITEVVTHTPVVIKATVTIGSDVFTGISAVLPTDNKLIEKQNPYEVAETSAVGRALAFAGYGTSDIASADEVINATRQAIQEKEPDPNAQEEQMKIAVKPSVSTTICEICGQPATEKKGTTRGGKAYHGIFCSSEDRSHTRWLWN
jgi:hypothetical protein